MYLCQLHAITNNQIQFSLENYGKIGKKTALEAFEKKFPLALGDLWVIICIFVMLL